MKYSLINFYGEFYGLNFFRHFRRLPDFKNDKIRMQFTVKNPKQLYLHVHKNSGFHACLIHVYDHGSYDNLNGKDRNILQYDRAFFDFDVGDIEVASLKHILQHLRFRNNNGTKKLQEKLKEKLRELIIDEKIAKPAIDEAKNFSKQFKKTFGMYPALFFSGCKGCHAYTFFNSSKFHNIDAALSWFAKNIEETYPTLDLSVVKDATSRLSRVPYSKHQLTDLTVVPFTIEDHYNDIMKRALTPTVEPFNQLDYFSNFNDHLQEIDKRLEHNREIKEAERQAEAKLNPSKVSSYKNIDHRLFFKNLLGEPEGEYPEKEYVMYNCPFQDHKDHTPSFRVHKTGYYCYGCQKKGNYWQFLKDYNNWNDGQVKRFLNASKIQNKDVRRNNT